MSTASLFRRRAASGHLDIAGEHYEKGTRLQSLKKPLNGSWRRLLLSLTALLCGLGLLFWPARTLRSDSFVFYFPNARHVIPLEVIDNIQYLPLLQVLNQVGALNGLTERRNNLKVVFGDRHIELHDNDPRVRLDKKTLILAAAVRVSNGKWMVPTDFLTTILSRLTSQDVEYQVGTNRVFIGNIRPGSFTLRMEQESNGAKLTFQFTDKVTVHTESVNGKWVMFLGDHPIQPLEQSFHFQNPYVSDVRFDDQDGLPKLVITPSAGGLNFYPELVEGGKVLRAELLKPAPPPPQTAKTPPPSTPSSTTASAPPATPAPSPGATPSTPAAPAAPVGPPLPVVVLDAGHGGEDNGARSRDGVIEKDLVAQLVARVRQALLTTGKFRVILTRTGDANVTFEQRAATANVAGAAYFLTFHAGDLGGGSPQVAIYTYQSASQASPSPEGATKPFFVAWDRVQENYIDQSRKLAQTIQKDLTALAGVTLDPPAAAPERTLRSVNAPAVAIEIGSLSPDVDAGPLTDTAFQLRLSSIVAEALNAFEGGGA
ncbi:MAG: N-acetylmuramoyl-L-alanine amidase [Terriglobia bacterium]|jgi:N-acetylmuramoyl-L-alanine amidase